MIISTVKREDTLSEIANKFGVSVTSIKETNNLLNDTILVNQKLEIFNNTVKVPNGYNQIVQTYGDIKQFVNKSYSDLLPSWKSQNLVTIDIGFSIPIAWDLTKSVTKVTCHTKIASQLQSVFTAINENKLTHLVTDYGGCYNFRQKRRSGNLSTHSWGIAIDINSLNNPMGSSGKNMPSDIVNIFKFYGFICGIDWIGKAKDPMHFQFCDGY